MKMAKAIRKQAGAAERAAFNATDLRLFPPNLAICGVPRLRGVPPGIRREGNQGRPIVPLSAAVLLFRFSRKTLYPHGRARCPDFTLQG